MCGSPDKKINSTVEVKTDVTLQNVSSIAIYSCPIGHRIVGPANRTCLPSGFWNLEAPSCQCMSIIYNLGPIITST